MLRIKTQSYLRLLVAKVHPKQVRDSFHHFFWRLQARHASTLMLPLSVLLKVVLVTKVAVVLVVKKTTRLRITITYDYERLQSTAG